MLEFGLGGVRWNTSPAGQITDKVFESGLAEFYAGNLWNIAVVGGAAAFAGNARMVQALGDCEACALVAGEEIRAGDELGGLEGAW